MLACSLMWRTAKRLEFQKRKGGEKEKEASELTRSPGSSKSESCVLTAVDIQPYQKARPLHIAGACKEKQLKSAGASVRSWGFSEPELYQAGAGTRQGVCCLEHALARGKITCGWNEQELQLAAASFRWSVRQLDCAPSTAEEHPGAGRAVRSEQLRAAGSVTFRVTRRKSCVVNSTCCSAGCQLAPFRCGCPFFCNDGTRQMERFRSGLQVQALFTKRARCKAAAAAQGL
ncbi:uncharacterized protein LOC128149265 isoform X2 [Harpia harpyja]|uniref:uncharacterized protein LOC128149265 isoform X2 n=1 Tax=Harpia harpyja TaxID=202280 RepID=UPI0022B1B536|nr:uncharacterized protein LOC128149265 isoform X2 [Harpia harpyja]